MAYFLRSREYSSFHLQSNLFSKKVTSHFFLRLFSSDLLSGESPSRRFKQEAITPAMLFMSSTAATTARNTCLKARIIISWTQRDCIWGSFSESSTWQEIASFYWKNTKNFTTTTRKHRKLFTTRPNERIWRPRVCIKSVSVLPSTGESSSEPKSATWNKKMQYA